MILEGELRALLGRLILYPFVKLYITRAKEKNIYTNSIDIILRTAEQI